MYKLSIKSYTEINHRGDNTMLYLRCVYQFSMYTREPWRTKCFGTRVKDSEELFEGLSCAKNTVSI